MQEARFSNSKAGVPQEGGTPFDCTRSTNGSARRDPRPRSTVVETEGPRSLLPTQDPTHSANSGLGAQHRSRCWATARRERTRGCDQSADAYGAKGGGAANQRGAGGEGAGAAEARVRPSLGLPSLPGAVRLGPEAACGEVPARGLQQRPGPTSQSSSPALSSASAATLLTQCLTSCGHRDQDGNPKRELQPTLPTPAAAPPHIQTPAKWRGGKGGGHSACASEAETRGGTRDSFGPTPTGRANRNPALVCSDVARHRPL